MRKSVQNWSDTNVDWFTSSAEEKIALPEYRLTFLWQEKNIAVAVDQVYSRVGGAQQIVRALQAPLACLAYLSLKLIPVQSDAIGFWQPAWACQSSAAVACTPWNCHC